MLFWAVVRHAQLCPVVVLGPQLSLQPEHVDAAEYEETRDTHTDSHHQQTSTFIIISYQLWNILIFLLHSKICLKRGLTVLWIEVNLGDFSVGFERKFCAGKKQVFFLDFQLFEKPLQ